MAVVLLQVLAAAVAAASVVAPGHAVAPVVEAPEQAFEPAAAVGPVPVALERPHLEFGLQLLRWQLVLWMLQLLQHFRQLWQLHWRRWSRR